MTARWQRVEVKLTVHQALRTERLGECLWPDEKLGIEEVSRRLLLEHVSDVVQSGSIITITRWQAIPAGR